MDAGARLRTFQPCAFARRRPGSWGFTQVETVVALAIAGLLAVSGLALMEPSGVDLTVARDEIAGCLEQAIHQARAQGRNVTVAPASVGGPNIIPVHLPRRVKWGKPAQIPLPAGMDEPRRAAGTGEAHPRITITPRRTATASAWFLNDGRECLCIRLSGHGRLQILRYRLRSRSWERA
jgi:type II secretory pathway pseudopilin PulG